jgi:RNA polymerase sigma factor (TIGR02999 family)
VRPSNHEVVLTDGTVTELLHALGAGDRTALARLMPIVYRDLQRMARAQLRRERYRRTLDTTVLVHEAYLKLVDQDRVSPADRGHFLAICARAMRQVIIDRARRRKAAKRGGAQEPITLELGDAGPAVEAALPAAELLALDEALANLERRNERLARVVECRFFAGLTEEETATALGISTRSVQRDWLRARAWLLADLQPAPSTEPEKP